MESLKLTYPSLQAGQEFLLDSNPKQIGKWLNELAFVDIDFAINELIRVTRTLNRSEVKPAHFEKNIYLLDSGYLQVSRHLREQNDKRNIKIDKEQLKTLHVLTSEMAFAFKRVISELSEQKMMLKKSQKIAKAINYAQHYLGLSLIEQYQLFSPIPSYIWRELHLLFSYAEQHKILDLSFSKELNDPLDTMQTISQTYIRNCMMAVINPYHIEDNQHWHIFKYISHWVKTIKLVSDTNKYKTAQCFIIDLNDGNKPHFADPDIEYQDESQVRLLLTQDFLSCINEHLDKLHNERQLPNPGFYAGVEKPQAEKLLQQVYAYCDHHVERNAARYPIMADVDTVWGMRSIQKIIQKPIPESANNNLEHWIGEQLDSHYEICIKWQAVNHSEGGLCINQVKQDVHALKVGNIVLMKRYVSDKPQKQWQLAIVRWLNGSGQAGATVGLEYIQGKIDIIHYLTKNRLGDLVKHPVLLVRPYDNSYPVMITAKNLIGNQKHIQLLVKDTQAEGHLTSMIESNSELSIYGLRVQKAST